MPVLSQSVSISAGIIGTKLCLVAAERMHNISAILRISSFPLFLSPTLSLVKIQPIGAILFQVKSNHKSGAISTHK